MFFSKLGVASRARAHKGEGDRPNTPMAEYEEDDGFDREAAEAMAELERNDGSDTDAARAMAELERRGAPRLAPEPAPRPQPPPRREGACVDCGTEALQPKFHAAFGLHVCYDCQRRFKVGSRLRPDHYPRPF